MQSSNQYIGEIVAKERVRDYLRDAERDRIVWCASQTASGSARTADPRIRRLSWIGRLISAIIGAW